MLSIALYLLTHAMLLSLHLSGGSFPRPLSAQEEKKYVERMLAGDIEAVSYTHLTLPTILLV